MGYWLNGLLVYWFIGLLGCPAERSEEGLNGLMVYWWKVASVKADKWDYCLV